MERTIKKKNRRDRIGFTLIEIMLVVIIIGVLVAMIVPQMSGRSEQAKIAVAEADIEMNIATALKLYQLDHGKFPTTEEGLDILLAAPPAGKSWQGPYLEREPLDPWGHPYQYQSPGAHRSYSYDLSSLGPDGVKNEDDIVNWEK
jgi:general secretion pathway protein G